MGRKIVFNKGVQEVITILYEMEGGKFTKVELQIKETYEEEKLIVQTTSRPKKSRKSSSSQKILTKKKQSKERLMTRSI